MLIYLVLVGLIFCMGLLLHKNKITKKQFCIIIGVAFVLITGLRGPNVGSDTTVYYIDYKAMEYVSWARLMSLEKRDIAFYVLSWSLSRATGGAFVVLTLLVAVVFYYPVMKLIYKFSDSPALSCYILMAFNFFQFSMTGMRQTMAFGFVMMFFLALHEKKIPWIKAGVFIYLAILFHRSAMIAFAYLLIRLVAKRGWNLKPLVAIVPVAFLMRSFIVTTFSDFFIEMGFDYSMDEGGGAGLTTFLVYCILTAGAMLIRDSKSDVDFPASEVFLYAVIASSLQTLVMVNSVFFRVAWYFALFFVILIPRFLKRGIFARAEMKTLRVMAYGAILFMYFVITKGSANVIPYEFFFQG